jgi:hypothetical protein
MLVRAIAAAKGRFDMTNTTTKTTHFRAPWGKLLVGMSTVGSVALGGGMLATASAIPPLAAVLGATMLVCAAGAVKGYRLEGNSLVIERLGRDKRVSLEGLTSVRHAKDLIHGALRVGNGGLYVFSGFFWSKKLGWFRLHGNDILGRAVLLEVGDTKWMITPENPEAFVAEASKLIKS